MASSTANDVVTAALKKLNLISEVETPSAAQAADGLSLLNKMMHGFSRKGIRYAHSDLTGTQTVNMPDDLIDDLEWTLARRMADAGYGVALTQQQAALMSQAHTTLQAAYFMRRASPVDSALRPRGYGGYNFTRGT
jgi:hypothetical protein